MGSSRLEDSDYTMDCCMGLSGVWTITPIHCAAITPVPAPRMTQRDKWAKRPCVVRYHAYRDLVRIEFKPHILALEAPYLLVATFAMPKSWNAKKRAKNRNQPHRQKPDKDNLEKAFLDALLEDDSGVWAGMVIKIWGDEDSIELLSIGGIDSHLLSWYSGNKSTQANRGANNGSGAG